MYKISHQKIRLVCEDLHIVRVSHRTSSHPNLLSQCLSILLSEPNQRRYKGSIRPCFASLKVVERPYIYMAKGGFAVQYCHLAFVGGNYINNR